MSTDPRYGPNGHHYNEETGELECLDDHKGDCRGPIEYRMGLSGTGKSFPRCDRHWEERLRFQDETNRKYPTNAPRDFDPSYAGEHWDEDY